MLIRPRPADAARALTKIVPPDVVSSKAHSAAVSSVGVAQFEQEGIPPIHHAGVAAVALERTRALSCGDPVEQRVGHRYRRDQRILGSDSSRVGAQDAD